MFLPDQERTTGTWMSHDTPRESVMMQVPNVGAFVRALLPVRLSGSYTVTYGIWLAINPRDLPSTFQVWWAPSYQDLRLTGWIANTVAPWGLLRAPVQATVRSPNETPYCATSDDAALSRVLAEEWDHELVLGALGGI
jgi:hypothetical protein